MKNYQLEEYQEYEETHLVRTWYYDVDSLSAELKKCVSARMLGHKNTLLKIKIQKGGVS